MLHDELKRVFTIPDEKLDDAILSLTHRQMLNINDSANYKENLNKSNYYSEIGKYACALILKEYIRKNISDDCNEVSKYYLAKEDYLDKFFELYNLDKYMIFKDEVCNNRNLQNITLQFIGFLFLNITFNKFKEILEEVFVNYSIELDIDYLSIVNIYLEGKTLNFKEVNRQGTANDPLFTYELLIDGIVIQETGRSKKEAKKNCAERFCNENFNRNQMKIYLDKNKLKNKKLNSVKISDKKERELQKLSQALKLNEQLVKVCCTHKSVASGLDNTTYRTMGAEVEIILILIYIYDYLRIKDFKRIQEIRSYLNSSTELYEKMCSSLEIENVMIYHNLTEEGIKKAKVDCIKALIYVSFYSDNRNNFIKKLYFNYDSFINGKQLIGLNPTTDVQEILQAYKIKNVEYSVEGDSVNFNCKASLMINSVLFEYTGNGKNKVLAKQNAAKYILYDLMNMECFSIKNIYGENILNKNLYREFISFILIDDNRFKIYMLKNDCLNIKQFINKDINNLIKFLEDLLLYFINEIKLSESLIRVAIEKLYKEFFYNCICGLPVIFLVIANDILNSCLIKRNSICKYNLEERKNYIYSKSREIIIEKINNDSSYIKNIPYPDEELQMIAVKKNKNTFFDINKPCKNIVNYIYNNDMKLLFKNNSQQNLDFLTELKVEEINELINNSTNVSIIQPHCFDIYIRAIFKVIEIKKVMIAVGFAYKSGIELIEDELNSVISKNGEVELIIGTLQQHNTNNPVSNMDLGTAKKLNIMIQQGVKIRTNENCFYHGKIYCFIGQKYSFIIIGSTNLSRNAFRYNKELDSMFMFPNPDNVYTEWFRDFWENSTEIDLLDEEKFKFHCFDNNEVCDKQNCISIDEMKKQVSLVTDKMLKTRLLLWLGYKPSNIYENILLANNEYVAIEYEEKSMIVLESFVPGNSRSEERR